MKESAVVKEMVVIEAGMEVDTDIISSHMPCCKGSQAPFGGG